MPRSWALLGYSAVGNHKNTFGYDTLRLGTARILHCKDYTSVGYSAVAHGTEGKESIDILKSNNSAVWVENFRVVDCFLF